jgi:uncharacterized protein YecT (DUF1311 family)
MTLFARTKVGAAFLIALAATTAGAAAQECSTSDSVRAITACYNKLLDQANADMQAKYQEAEGPVKRLSQLEQALTKSQEDWVAYRNETCDNLVRLYWLEGQLETVNVINCKLALTRERTSDLENMLHALFDAKH